MIAAIEMMHRQLHRYSCRPSRLSSGVAHISSTSATHGHDQATSLGCKHYSKGCAGCSREHDLLTPDQFSDAKSVFESYGHLDFQLVSGPIHGWRCRAKLAVRGSKESPEIGLFRKGTHEVVDIVGGEGDCLIHHPRINEAAEAIKNLMKKLSVSPYNERSRQGLFRYIQLTVVGREVRGYRAEEDPEASVQFVLIVNSMRGQGKELKAARDLAMELWLKGKEGLAHSIWLNFNPATQDSKRSENAIIGSDGFELLHGEEEVWQRFGGPGSPTISLGPGAFVQANYGTFSLALRGIRRYALEKESVKVLELHSGVGSIGLSLFEGGKGPDWLRCVELNPAGEYHFRKSKERLMEGTVKTNGSLPDVDYLVAPASDERCLRFLGGIDNKGVDVIIVDPPKKGLEPELISVLASIGKEGNPNQEQTLIYLSCGWAALKKEMAILLGAKWRLVHAQAFLFFPGTEAIEILAVFRRGNKSKKT